MNLIICTPQQYGSVDKIENEKGRSM